MSAAIPRMPNLNWIIAHALAATLLLLASASSRAGVSTTEMPASKAAVRALTAREVFDRAAPAVVKLYGASVGRQQGYGTGVLISPDGLILTNLSVMLAGRSIRSVLHDGATYDAELVRRDESRKLALLRIKASNLPYLTPQSSEGMQTGDAVYALGNWFKIAEGDEHISLTRGVFSFKATIDARRLAQEYDYPGPVLVYDAITANPGAAGGPLLDADGRLVGLVGLIVEAAATNTRVNHAIPGEDLIAFLAQGSTRTPPRAEPGSDPIGESSPRRPMDAPSKGEPFIGITLSKIGYRQTWAFVERVRRGSPADRAGIRPDDLIIAVDGRRVADAADYGKLTATLTPGQRVPFTLKRGTEIITVEVVVSALASESQP